MSDELSEQLRDKLTKVCICKGINRKVIKEAIALGAKTVEEVNRATGSGSGGCGGRRCGPKIEVLLQQAGGDEELQDF